MALEVGTDGLYSHVDRDLDHAALELEILERIAYTCWERAGIAAPWSGAWHLQEASS